MADDPIIKDPLSDSLPPSEFSHIITKLAVTQICQSLGFKGAQSSALNTLTRIATLYLQSVATSAASSAAVCGGRTQCNLFDITHALEHLRLPSGFPGAGDITRPLLKSSALNELRLFVNDIDEAVPFSRRIPPQEMNSGSVVFFPAMSRSGELKRGAEVPRWLPEFPCFGEAGEKRSVSKREARWEENRSACECAPIVVKIGTEKEKGSGKFMLQGKGRREKVKFRVGVRNGRVGVDDLELRNGVCRGGKRVCLIKQTNMLVKGDEDKGLLLESNSQNCCELRL